LLGIVVPHLFREHVQKMAMAKLRGSKSHRVGNIQAYQLTDVGEKFRKKRNKMI